MRISSRRQFLWLTIGAGAPLGFGLSAWLQSAGTASEGQPVSAANLLQVIRRTDWVLNRVSRFVEKP